MVEGNFVSQAYKRVYDFPTLRSFNFVILKDATPKL